MTRCQGQKNYFYIYMWIYMCTFISFLLCWIIDTLYIYYLCVFIVDGCQSYEHEICNFENFEDVEVNVFACIKKRICRCRQWISLDAHLYEKNDNDIVNNTNDV